MAGKLVVVSNRIPMDSKPSGGLVVALHEALEHRGGTWIGAHPDRTDAPREELEEVGSGPYRKLAMRLTKQEYEEYYLGFANSVLWPICHRRGDLVHLGRDLISTYLEVNRRLARQVAKVAGPEDRIWIHDYHLLPLAHELRRLGVSARIGFFLHIPFPALGDLAALPQPEDFAMWMAAPDLVGLQTRSDVARCLEMFRSDPRAEFLNDGTVKFRDTQVSVRSFPIGIDPCSFARAAAEPLERDPFGPDMKGDVILGVDRLDYSKGLPNRFLAFGDLLASRRPEDRRVSLVQIAPPTREEVHAYRNIRSELEEIAGRINGEHADLDWTPIRYIHRALDRTRLAQLYRRADVGLVTPFADGMNLVAKEYIAAQDPDDPGVLVLSRMAGAAEDMQSALLVNPYDVTEIADGIRRALAMPLEERRARFEDCMAVVRDTAIGHWTETFLARLDSAMPTLKLRHRAAAARMESANLGEDRLDETVSEER